MQKVVQEKGTNIANTLTTRWKNPVEYTIITNDAATGIFNTVAGVLLFIGASTATIITGGVFGIVGGLLNIYEGYGAGKFAYDHLRTGNYAEASKLAMCCVVQVLIGVVMILVSTVAILAIGGVISASLAAILANPYTLPALFFILICVVAKPLVLAQLKISRGEDVGAKMDLAALKWALNSANHEDRLMAIRQRNAETLASIKRIKEENKTDDDAKAIIRLTEDYIADIGVDAGQELMKLSSMLLNAERDEVQAQLLAQVEACQTTLNTYYRSVKVRLIQYSAYLMALPCTMVALGIASLAKLLIAGSGFFLALGWTIAGYNDITKPFLRSYPLAVPMVDMASIVSPTGTTGVDLSRRVAPLPLLSA